MPARRCSTHADVAVLLDAGPEVISGSTRMGAGTAQKAALNMLSTLVGVRLGHVYDGLMVNVKADNDKLRGRAARIVTTIHGRQRRTRQPRPQAIGRRGQARHPDRGRGKSLADAGDSSAPPKEMYGRRSASSAPNSGLEHRRTAAAINRRGYE